MMNVGRYRGFVLCVGFIFKMDPLKFWRENADFFNTEYDARRSTMEENGRWIVNGLRAVAVFYILINTGEIRGSS